MKIDGFSSYEIFPEEGKIFSYKTNDFVSGSPDKNGYIKIGLYDDNGKRFYFHLHRLIWECQNGSIPKGFHIHHINHNRTDNRLSNLQMLEGSFHLTQHRIGVPLSENAKTKLIEALRNTPKTEKHKRNLSIAKGKPVGAYKDGVLVMTFHSAKEAGRNGFYQSSVSDCCNGKYKQHKGYEWKYLT